MEGISTRLAKERLIPTRILIIKSKFVLPGFMNPPDAPRVASLALFLSIVELGFEIFLARTVGVFGSSVLFD
jgi:hypothetical protein